MGLTVVSSSEQERREREALASGGYTLERRYVLTQDGTLEPEETGSGTFFGGPGKVIPIEDARRYGLLAADPAAKASPAPEDKAVARAQTEDKAARRKGK